MQLLSDLFPVIAFFIAFKLGDIYIATGVLIAAVVLQTGYQWIRHRKVSKMALISGVLVLVFGGLTLAIHDEMFIKWKVSVVNWLFALGFLLSQFIGQKPFSQHMLGEQVKLGRPQWLRLNLMWVLFFAAMGAINLYVAYHFSTDTWASFKLFGVLGLTLVFALVQGVWLMSKQQPSDSNKGS